MIASRHQGMALCYNVVQSICMYSVLGTHQTKSSKTTPTNLDKYLLDFVSWEGGDWELSCVPSIEFTFRPYSVHINGYEVSEAYYVLW